jgi:beta-lactamase regulating signal transducer with metallopeptidase domain
MSVTIAGLILLTYVFKRPALARWRYICWIAVAVGLIIPMRLPVITFDSPQPVVQAERFVSERAVMPIFDDSEYREMVAEFERARLEAMWSSFYTSNSAGAANDTAVADIAAAPAKPIEWGTLIFIVWAAGVVLFTALCVIRHIRFIRHIKRWGYFAADEKLLGTLERVRSIVKVKQSVKILICPAVDTPVMIGFFKPLIVLPEDMTNDKALELILAHELVHYKYGDAWVKILTLTAWAAHWFNPLMLLMNKAISRDCEIACDQKVLRCMGMENRKEYCNAVFETAYRATPRIVISPAFSNGERHLKSRLASIIEQRHMRRWVAVCCAVMLVGATLFSALLTGCNETPEPTPEPTPVDGRTWNERFEEEGMTSEVHDLMIEENTARSIEEIMKKEIVVDETQAGDLEIWVPPIMQESFFLPAIVLYEQMYPNVNVTVWRFKDSLDIWSNYNAYTIQLATELIAGRGPDVLFTSHMPPNADLYKMADNGTFLDLNELIEQDEDFNLDDYVKAAIDGGIYKGKRYAIPVNYTLDSIIRSIPRNLNKIGFDSSQLSDVTSFMNEIMRTLPEAQKQPAFKVMKNNSLWWHYLHKSSGIKLIDYETGTILPDEDGLRQLAEAYKPYYPLDNKHFLHIWWEHLISGVVLFEDVPNVNSFLSSAVIPGDQINALRGIDGKVHASPRLSTAIRSGSKNQQNAWNFIKLLLSPEMQNNNMIVFLPLHKDTLIGQIKSITDFDSGVTPDGVSYFKFSEERVQEYIDMLINVDYCDVLAYSFSYENYITALGRFFDEHMIPYFEDKVSLDDAINGLRNTLRLYLSE